MPVRVLATGDIHIGRRPSRVPERDLAERASAARMWDAIVSRAIAEQVDAVMLTGDIIDHASRYYEAIGPLEHGILRLADAGIPTYAVAGNHDWDVFPRILEQLNTPLFHFIGRRGSWEETYLERDGQPLLRLVGWSFPARYVYQSPLTDFRIDSDPRVPTVGLLHADVDVLSSQYAPVKLADLQSRGITMWILGHIHKPQHWPSGGDAAALYPGSPQALGPNEPGPHGPWLIEFEGLHSAVCRQIPMSLVRYQECIVDLGGADRSDVFDNRVSTVISTALDEAANDDEPPQLLSLRLNFVGATSLCRDIDSLAGQLNELERSRGGVRVRIDNHVNLTRPAIDLDALSRQNDPAGVLARTLIALERNGADEAITALTHEAYLRLLEIHRASSYVPLMDRDPIPDHETARRILLRTGWQLLETLRSQLPQPQEASS